MRPAIMISMVASANDTATRDVQAEKILCAIRQGKWKKPVEEIRQTYARELLRTTGDHKAAKLAVDQLKKKLPGILWSGRFKQRNNGALIQHSGLLCANLDTLNGFRLAVATTTLPHSPHLWALFQSPTGYGLKAVFRVPADAVRHGQSFRAIEQHVRELTGIQIDEACKDVERLCFVSYDPGTYLNPAACEIEPLPEPEKPQRPENTAVDLSARQRIAKEILGIVDWQSDTGGFAACPGKDRHTTGDGKRDCEVYLDNVPTIHCVHNSCRAIVEAVNHTLRSRIGKVENSASQFVAGRGVDSGKEVKSSDNPTATSTRVDVQSEGDVAVELPRAATDEEEIARLAALPLLEYERARKEAANKLNCRPAILDSLIDARRLLMRASSDTDNLQGAAVKLKDVEPWPAPVNGAEILDEIAHRFLHYVIMPEGAADMFALWCAHTHIFKVFQISPRVHVSSPTQECGKTNLRDCASLFCARQKRTDGMTTAVMFRLVNGHSPTILADECDKWLFINEELVGLICSGHRKSGTVLRCEGDSNELREFGCYAPMLLAAIGALPSQLHSRSIVVRLERAKREEIKKCAQFELEHTEYEHDLCRKLARWITDNRERIAACKPKLPENIFNRIADNWRPLFQIAEVAGGNWPKRCANALVKLTTREDDAESLRVLLLADIKQVFTDERIFSKVLVDALNDLKERPWPEICHGKPMTERWLARNLAVFGIHSKSIRIGEGNAKGYELVDFAESFERYILPGTLDSKRHTVTHEGKAQILSVTKGEVVTDTKNESFPREKAFCDAVTDKKGGVPLKTQISAHLNPQKAESESATNTEAIEDTEGEL